MWQYSSILFWKTAETCEVIMKTCGTIFAVEIVDKHASAHVYHSWSWDTLSAWHSMHTRNHEHREYPQGNFSFQLACWHHQVRNVNLNGKGISVMHPLFFKRQCKHRIAQPYHRGWRFPWRIPTQKHQHRQEILFHQSCSSQAWLWWVLHLTEGMNTCLNVSLYPIDFFILIKLQCSVHPPKAKHRPSTIVSDRFVGLLRWLAVTRFVDVHVSMLIGHLLDTGKHDHCARSRLYPSPVLSECT